MYWAPTQSYISSRHEDVELASTWGKTWGTLERVAEFATALLQTRGDLRPLDYLALGAAATKASVGIYSTWRGRPPELSLADFFDLPGSGWRRCSSWSTVWAFGGMEVNERLIEDHKQVFRGKVISACWTAVVDGVEIGWVGPPNQNAVPDNIWSKDPDRVWNIVSRRLWEKAGSDNIIRIEESDCIPYNLPSGIIETTLLRDTADIAKKFIEKGKPWAMILDGEPGTGKTVAAGYVARKFDYRMAVLDASSLVGAPDHVDLFTAETRASRVAAMLKPDVLLINDIDRLTKEGQLELLSFLDSAKSFARLVFVTTNHYRSLIEPIRRPGRLDEIVHVPGLTLDEIRKVAPDLPSIADKMIGWPIAYVRSMQDRFDVLGSAALDHYDRVANRLSEVREDGKYPLVIERKSTNGVADIDFDPETGDVTIDY